MSFSRKKFKYRYYIVAVNLKNEVKRSFQAVYYQSQLKVTVKKIISHKIRKIPNVFKAIT